MSSSQDLLKLLCHPTEPLGSLSDDETEKDESGLRPQTDVRTASASDDDLLQLSKQLGREEHFSVFIPRHAELAADIIQTYMKIPSREEFIKKAKSFHDHMNPSLYQYTLSVAVTHRKDTSNIRLPSLMAVFPDRFITCKDWVELHKIFSKKENENEIYDLDTDFTATDLEEEHRLAYFREDPGLNIHHYHWHLVYPVVHRNELKQKDRQGELFYYMHQQLMARYNFERFSNHLKRTQRLLHWYEPISEAYFPKLPNTAQGGLWMSRQSGTRLSNVVRSNDVIDIPALERFRDRIYQSIHWKSVLGKDNTPIPLDAVKGIDILGSLVEANDYSVNRLLYGNLHNDGHNVIAFSHDPDGRHTSFMKNNEVVREMGVMGEVTTACRDPVFYRWHAFIDDLFQDFKRTLPPYEDKELDFPNVEVESVEVETENADRKNEFITFWKKSVVDIQQGIDFVPVEGEKKVRFTHLQHSEFTYVIKVMCNSVEPLLCKVRIFMSPKYDEANRRMRWEPQRTLFIELDKFLAKLNPGLNVVERQSWKSNVTIPFQQQFRPKPTVVEDNDEMNYCSCGWPDYLLIPKGRPEGMACQLFVMITDYNDDKVEVKNMNACGDGSTYCGLRDELYPDRRAMGFPFDRKVDEDIIKNVEDFVGRHKNMYLSDVSIRFSNEQKIPDTMFTGQAPFIVNFDQEIPKDIPLHITGMIHEDSEGFRVSLQVGDEGAEDNAALQVTMKFEPDSDHVASIVLTTLRNGDVTKSVKHAAAHIPLVRNNMFGITIKRKDQATFQVVVNGITLEDYKAPKTVAVPTHLFIVGGVTLFLVSEDMKPPPKIMNGTPTKTN